MARLVQPRGPDNRISFQLQVPIPSLDIIADLRPPTNLQRVSMFYCPLHGEHNSVTGFNGARSWIPGGQVNTMDAVI